jgi:TPP-dependent pyruvate/acetoin dehydrogenase alpha subunit
MRRSRCCSRCSRAADVRAAANSPTTTPITTRHLSISSIIAAHCPHAVGAAYAMKLFRESGRAVLCTFGDGATSEGEWHESSTSRRSTSCRSCSCARTTNGRSRRRSAADGDQDVADKAPGLRIPGVKVDGTDPDRDLRREGALERARSGGGPTLVEAKCYRFLSHTTDDDDRTYRTREEIERHRAPRSAAALRALLLEHGRHRPRRRLDAMKARRARPRSTRHRRSRSAALSRGTNCTRTSTKERTSHGSSAPPRARPR